MKFRVLMGVVLLSLLMVAPALAQDGGLHVRFAHLSPATAAVDVYVNDEMAVMGLAYKSVSDYQQLDMNMLSVAVTPAGSAVDQALLSNPMLNLPEEGCFTVAIIGSAADQTLELLVLPVDGVMAADGSAMSGNITISGAWARATAMETMPSMGGMAEATPEMGGMAEATPEAGGMGGMGGMAMGDVSAAYMLIENAGSQPEMLVGVETDVAGVAEVHETVIENDVAKMQPIEKLEVPAGGSVELKPRSYHIMLMELKQPLLPGDVITLTLKFESGLEVTLDVPVKMPA